MKKKSWETPELIIFIKGDPEDSILTVCKSSKSPTNALGATTGNHCQALEETNPNCGACHSNGGGIS